MSDILPINRWTLPEAIALIVKIEALCPKFGCHVALTGGLLYKPGPRKDLDILFYRIRQVEQINLDDLWPALKGIGIEKFKGFWWCYKAVFGQKMIDIFMPEEQEDGEGYPLEGDGIHATLPPIALEYPQL